MFATLIAIAGIAAQPIGEPLPGAKRVLILGDSITAAGMYTVYLETYFATRFPDREIEFINLGLPSETISGQSEPAHPWPRPSIHERLERALRLRPDVVIACYGMNDGIYHPFAAERFTAFQEGIDHLIADCWRWNSPLVLLTPPPFDAVPVRSILKSDGDSEYSWKTPYARYQEDVLAKYAEWEKLRAAEAVAVIDTQTPILRFLAATRMNRETRDYVIAEDGVHMNADGHWLMATAILRRWEGTLRSDSARIDVATLRASHGDVNDVRAEAGGIRFTWMTKLPMPADPDWSATLRDAKAPEVWRDRHLVSITGLRDGTYSVCEGNNAIGRAESTKGELTFDLREFREASSNRMAERLGELIRQRERIMSPAWRDDVGHKRPDSAKGLPLAEAKAKVEPITAEIRRLRKPVTLNLSVRAN